MEYTKDALRSLYEAALIYYEDTMFISPKTFEDFYQKLNSKNNRLTLVYPVHTGIFDARTDIEVFYDLNTRTYLNIFKAYECPNNNSKLFENVPDINGHYFLKDIKGVETNVMIQVNVTSDKFQKRELQITLSTYRSFTDAVQDIKCGTEARFERSAVDLFGNMDEYLKSNSPHTLTELINKIMESNE